MLVGSAAIAGLPVFSGFFSKDEILYMVINQARGGMALFALGMLAAFLTAIYTIKLLALTFWGERRFTGHPHESPLIMTGPLFVLAFLATFGGFWGLPHEWAHGYHFLSNWLSSVVPPVAAHAGGVSEALVSVIAVLVSVLGFGLGYALFRKGSELRFLGLEKLWEAKYYVDELYQLVFVVPLHRVGALIQRSFEEGFMFRLGAWMGTGVQWSGDRLRTLQNGDLQAFVLVMVTGLVLVVGILWTWARV
jgi:NADH-quinone oxidoreductase subunit L